MSMEQEPQPESIGIPEVETERSAEVEAIDGVYWLPEALGFTETPELARLHDQYVEAIRSESEETRDLAIAYRTLAEEAVDQIPSAHSQIALLVQFGNMRRDGGRPSYVEDWQDALDYAEGEQALSKVHDGKLDLAVETLQMAIGEARIKTYRAEGWTGTPRELLV